MFVVGFLAPAAEAAGVNLVRVVREGGGTRSVGTLLSPSAAPLAFLLSPAAATGSSGGSSSSRSSSAPLESSRS